MSKNTILIALHFVTFIVLTLILVKMSSDHNENVKQEHINDAVAEAFEDYLDLNGYVE